MTSDADRDLLLKWLASPEGEPIRDALQATLKALERGEQATTPEAIDAAWSEALTAYVALRTSMGIGSIHWLDADDALLEALGLAALAAKRLKTLLGRGT